MNHQQIRHFIQTQCPALNSILSDAPAPELDRTKADTPLIPHPLEGGELDVNNLFEGFPQDAIEIKGE